MRQLVLDQLKKCQWANVSGFDPATGICLIPKYKKPEYLVNHCYLIKLPGDILNNSNTVLATNWNHGASPSYPYLKAYVSKLLGKMIYVEALGFSPETNSDLNYMWSGWLDAETLTLVSVL